MEVALRVAVAVEVCVGVEVSPPTPNRGPDRGKPRTDKLCPLHWTDPWTPPVFRVARKVPEAVGEKL